MQLLHSQADSLEDAHSMHPLVLVVDDDHATREMLCYVLSFFGYRPVCRANGLEALVWLEQALREGQYPQAILLDFFMPIMNGRAFLEHLPHAWSVPIPIPPVILVTVDTSHRYDTLPCSKVLIKPFHMRELVEWLKVATQKVC